MKMTFASIALVLMTCAAACRDGTGRDTSSNVPPAGAPGAASSQAPPAPPPVPEPPPPPKPDEGATQSGAKYRDVTLPAGTKLGVRLNGSVDSETAKVEDPVDATLIQPIVINETEVVPAGAHFKGRVTAAGRENGRPRLALAFTMLELSGDSYPVSAEISEAAPATKGADAARAGIPAGGDKIAGGKNDAFPKGTVLSLRLARALTVKVANKAGK